MHITILALGSYGDVLPIAILGQGLKAAGHQVRVATFENFETMVAQHGLDFHPIRGDSQAILNAGGGRVLTESGQNIIRAWWAAMQSFGVLAEGIAHDLSSPALWKTDLIINQMPGGLYGYDLAEKIGVPMVMAAVMPLTRTRHFPMLAFPPLFARFPGYNVISYRIFEQLMWQWFRPTINRWRKETLGLPKQSFGGNFGKAGTAHIPILNGFSCHVVPRPADWGDGVYVTGYWFPEEESWQPPHDLQTFIEASSPPVFIGFGSMSVRDVEGTTAVILEALKQSELRAVLHAGWAGIGNDDLPDNVFKIDYAPYSWLFPQMAAVVHHGGSGTAAFGFRAGVPSIIVPFLFDQFFWGERVFRLGVGPKPTPFRKLSASRLAEALMFATTDSSIRERAFVLGEKIRAENGTNNSVKIISDRL
ncbi:MAG: glycosyltransferase family 1 protein [Chloroflexi bacterium]|nr:glycosyltransferase family 1 protein [Chloroflexota bacterium]